MKECSIIVIVNNINIYESFLENLHTQENVDFEVIPVWNINNKQFNSARKALEYGASCSDAKYLLFVHADIRFLSNNTLRDLLDLVTKIGDFGVIGVAGCPYKLLKNDRIIYSTILHGDDKKQAGFPFDNPIEVQTVDECLFIQKSDYFKKTKFTKKEGWHLYAVEQCLRAKEDGLKNYVIPTDIWHMSDGKSLDPNYVKQITVLLKEYSDKYEHINTTVKRWKTKGISSNLYLIYYYFKQKIKKKIIKL